MADPTRRELELEAELRAMTRYARRLEATETASRVRRGEPNDEVLAAIRDRRSAYGVTATMRRLFQDERPHSES